MSTNYKTRLLLALAALGVALYLVFPTAVYFSLSEQQLQEVKQDKDAFDKYVPTWASRSHLVPGLDLQGGIRLLLGVDVDRALSDRASRLAGRLREKPLDKAVALPTAVTHLAQQGQPNAIQLQFGTKSEASSFWKEAQKRFPELVLQGQTESSLTLQFDASWVAQAKSDAVAQTIRILRTRIDRMGVTEPTIARQGMDRIQIQLPGYDDPQEAKNLIGRTAQLEFRMCDDDTDILEQLKDLPKNVELIRSNYRRPDESTGKDIYLQFPADQLEEVKKYLAQQALTDHVIRYGSLGDRSKQMRTFTLNTEVPLTGDDLIDARVTFGSDMDPRAAVAVTFSPAAAQTFDELTQQSIGKRMAIVLEDLVDSAPVIQQRISGGTASISMGGARTPEEMIKDANQLALVLKAGALPAPVSFREERSVGPSLGAQSVQAARQACSVGAVLIALFMLAYYRLGGLFALIGVAFNLTFVIAALSVLGATITLPGVAGLLLTVGMAVDANIIINERIGEELLAKKSFAESVKLGYDAAFSAVMDANVTTFIAGVVLWQFGTGPVQNFATTLLVGTVSSVFTAIFITRIFFDMTVAHRSREITV
ncbi:MAG: protein translocase subunit SecD [Myxococcota bacterium]